MKRKYTKRKGNKEASISKSKDLIKSPYNIKLITSDLTRTSVVFKNDTLVLLNELSLKKNEIDKSVLLKEPSTLFDSLTLCEIKEEVELTKAIHGYEILNLKTNNKLWIYKRDWSILIGAAGQFHEKGTSR